ncbi:MAG: hypothetical protein ABL895_00230 [Cyclobacteriaceae bacterium]
MKCKEFEEGIYLYEELTGSEKALVDNHRSHCEACNKLAEQVIQSGILIKRAGLLKTEAKNPHQLTLRIMNSIAKEKEVSVLDYLASYFDNLFIRYAFGMASLLLVVFFLYEQQSIDRVDPITKITNTEVKPGPVLDMNVFLNHYRNQRVKKDPVPISKYAYYKSVRSLKTYNQ